MADQLSTLWIGEDDPYTNRRSDPRLEIPPLDVSAHWAAVRDISAGGISLLVDKPMATGERCELMLTDAFFHTTEELHAEVVWSWGACVGLKWVDQTEAQGKWLRSGFKRWRLKGLPVRVTSDSLREATMTEERG